MFLFPKCSDWRNEFSYLRNFVQAYVNCFRSFCPVTNYLGLKHVFVWYAGEVSCFCVFQACEFYISIVIHLEKWQDVGLVEHPNNHRIPPSLNLISCALKKSRGEAVIGTNRSSRAAVTTSTCFFNQKLRYFFKRAEPLLFPGRKGFLVCLSFFFSSVRFGSHIHTERNHRFLQVHSPVVVISRCGCDCQPKTTFGCERQRWVFQCSFDLKCYTLFKQLFAFLATDHQVSCLVDHFPKGLSNFAPFVMSTTLQEIFLVRTYQFYRFHNFLNQI